MFSQNGRRRKTYIADRSIKIRTTKLTNLLFQSIPNLEPPPPLRRITKINPINKIKMKKTPPKQFTYFSTPYIQVKAVNCKYFNPVFLNLFLFLCSKSRLTK